jgi:transposase
MAKTKFNPDLDVMHPVCCAMDVHKQTISACLITVDKKGAPEMELRDFGTFTDDLVELKQWLLSRGCPIVAMESTGIYWRPVHNILEDCFQIILVNARHVKNLPGKKTDKKDAAWLARLLRCGLLKASFIPPKQIRELRDLTRLRKSYVEMVADQKRRVHKHLESANIKIDSVASDLFGATGQQLMHLLLEKPEIEFSDIDRAARKKLRTKKDELFRSVQGNFSEHHQFLLGSLLKTIRSLEEQIFALDSRIACLTSHHGQLIERLDEIPGINEIGARAIISEIGTTLDEFSSPAALCSWAGLCPGNNETAGKRRSGKTAVRKHHLKTILIECSWAAIKTKNSFYRAKYYALKARRGAKKAIVAIAHKIAKAIYPIIKEGQRYTELGEDFFVKRKATSILNRMSRQAKLLGYRLVPVPCCD